MEPVIVVAGGGPAGLLSALTLSRRGLNVSVLERDAVPEQWSSRSFSIGLSERGQAALRKTQMMDAVRAKCNLRYAIVRHESDGTSAVQELQEPRLGITRPLLVSTLEEQLIAEGKVTIRRGVSVGGVCRSSKSGFICLKLTDGTEVNASHIVGADGKFSAVRREVAALQQQEGGPELSFTLHEEPAFGLLLGITDQLPDGWRRDATHVVMPSTLRGCVYAIVSFLANQQLSISVVFSDKILDTHPWLLPPKDQINSDWSSQATPSSTPDEWGSNLHALLTAEFPAIARDIPWMLSFETLSGTEIRRRVSWVEITTGRFDALDGRVALIGDAAHNMTASIGLGCNCALECATALDEAIGEEIAARRSAEGDGGGGGDGGQNAGAAAPTVEELTAAFVRYGMKRPGEVREAQQQSAAGSRK